MQQLNLPTYNFEINKVKEQFYIKDIIRKKLLLLTPEEWVRQNLISYLVHEKKFPVSLFSIETGIKVNTLQKRYDALVYSRTGTPLLLIECKAPGVQINQKVFDQIIAYDSMVNAPYLLVSNGLKHYFLSRNSINSKFVFESDIPAYDMLKF